MDKNKLNAVGLIVAIILLTALIYLTLEDKLNAIENPYYAVYLQTGDMYFGKLSRFPKLTLSDVWFLQRNIDEEQGGFNLIKYSDAMFGPENKMEINKENVVWISKLRDDSQVVSFILQSKTPALQNVQPQAAPQTTLPAAEE